MSTDIINAIFNLCGAVAVSSSIYKLLQDKVVRGIYWPMIIFFISWSTWNLYFYGVLGQWYSVLGGISIVTAEAIYIYLLVHFSNLENLHKDSFSSYIEEMGNRNSKKINNKST